MNTNTILVVEDDAGLREALIDTLEMSGIDCVAADSAEQAMILLKQNSYSLVVSDVQMGAMSGLDLLRSIKLNYPELPVLMMTAYATIDDAVEANILASDLSKKISGELFNIGTGKNYSILDIKDMVNGPFKFIEARPGEARYTLADNTKAKNLLSWEPKTKLEDWIKSNNV